MEIGFYEAFHALVKRQEFGTYVPVFCHAGGCLWNDNSFALTLLLLLPLYLLK